MNNPYLLSEPEKTLIDKVFAVALVDGADCDEKWAAGIVLLADCLLRLDELNRERLLRGLEGALRDALRRIPEIQRDGVSPNAPERLQ
jgi:hypothetical protein